MKKAWLGVVGWVIVGLARPVCADELIMRDGSVRWGTVVSKDNAVVQFRMERDGMSSLVVIPVGQIARLIMGAMPPPVTAATTASGSAGTTLPGVSISGPTTGPTVQTATTGPATHAGASNATQPGAVSGSPPTAIDPVPAGGVPSASDAELAAFASQGFLRELLAASMGNGPDDIRRLPAADRDLLQAAMAADKNAKPGETLEALRGLEAAMQDLPEGVARLEAIARRERGEGFGIWMARVHWDVISTKYSTGQFDLNDVRPAERRPLIGILRKATSAAMEPLKPYFPPVDEKTGLPGAFKPAQLTGVTVANALDIKDKALFAAAIILAQMKLEPEMPAVDKALFGVQLANVNRVLARARDLETLARAALVRAEQQRRVAEEKARRAAAIAAQKAGTSPK